ncbi:MAG: SIR2 family protein [Negativicutes bacterium]|nr:SIR2 family protein [Negativicutes bacterium]
MKTAIFLGGGASAAEGAPQQSELIRDYFRLLRPDKDRKPSVMYREIVSYFRKIFSIDIDREDLDTISFPTFEEALGLLDLAVRRREAFKDFDLENISQSSNRIGFMRQYLVLLLAAVLDDSRECRGALHRRMVGELDRSGFLQDTVFVTTNYDTLIDNALADVPGSSLDYGLEFANRSPAGGDTPNLYLFKVHGSLNWLHCPSCNTISLTGKNQGVLDLLTDRHRSGCQHCGAIILPVIVPPTFFKDTSNLFFNIVWNQAEQRLREVQKIIFCGYSFPDSDMHIKYLLKRAQVNRPEPQPLQFFVINGHPGKNPYQADKERHRYQRFLGPAVEYTDLSFENFVADPGLILSR